MRRGSIALIAVALLTLAACSNKRPLVPPEKLWADANQAFGDEAYDYAIQKYKALLDQHPFDEHAEEAELKIAEAYYLAQRYPEAIAAFGNFERMYPTSENLSSVEYHRGLSYLAQYTSSDRDQQAVTNALNSFRNIVDRFPQTPWADRASLRMRECREALARHEADVATYYLKRHSLRAAESRLRGLLTEYPETDATAETLYAFAHDYGAREEPEPARLAYLTLMRHHPDGPLAADARTQMHDDPPGDDDPLPRLVAFLDGARSLPDRQQVPRAVSAYPDTGNASGARY
jgi:outer membrane protein assembly factor BamD